MKKTISLIFLTVFNLTLFAQWIPLTDNCTGGSLYSNGEKLFCFSENAIYISNNNGESWNRTINGLPNRFNIYSYTFIENNPIVLIEAENERCFYYSEDQGESWILQSSFYQNHFGNLLFYDGQALFLQQTYPETSILLRSIDNGNSWEEFSNGISSSGFNFIGACNINNTTFICSYDKIYKTDNNTGWTEISLDIEYPFFIQLFNHNDKLVLVDYYNNTYISNDYGETWEETTGTFSGTLYSICQDGETTYASTANGIYKLNNTDTWVAVNTSFTGIGSIAIHNAYFFSVKEDNIYRSSDNFQNNTKVNYGLAIGNDVLLHKKDSRLYAITDHGSYFYSDNLGEKWYPVQIPDLFGATYFFESNDTCLFLGTRYDLLTKENNSDWEITPIQGSGDNARNDILFMENTIYIATDNGIYKCEDSNYENWGYSLNEDLSEEVPPYYTIIHEVKDIDTLNNELYISTNKGIYKSSNNGFNWTLQTEQIPFEKLISINQRLIATSGSDFYISNTEGTTWTELNTGLPEGLLVESFFVYEDMLFLGSVLSGAFISSDTGSTWSSISSGLTDLTINTFLVDDGYIYIGTNNGAWKRPLFEVNENYQEIIMSFSFKIYPNPSSDIAIIDISDDYIGGEYGISIYSSDGRLVHHEYSYSDEVRINTSSFSHGIYIVKVASPDYYSSQKLIVK